MRKWPATAAPSKQKVLFKIHEVDHDAGDNATRFHWRATIKETNSHIAKPIADLAQNFEIEQTCIDVMARPGVHNARLNRN